MDVQSAERTWSEIQYVREIAKRRQLDARMVVTQAISLQIFAVADKASV